ncbi:MAG: TolC family protein, partial [Planctomycetota bacterium]
LDETEFLDEFLLGAVFEQPIGNRAAEAGYRRARLQRMLSVVSYRDTLQGIVLEIKDAIDDLVTSYELAEQARISRIAAGEALRSLQVEKRLTERGFTVERLDVELNTQDALAEAERTEVFALLAYNRSIAALHRAMGTSLQRNRIDFVVPDTNQVLEGNSALDYRLGDDG